jgi:hypothetical protein
VAAQLAAGSSTVQRRRYFVLVRRSRLRDDVLDHWGRATVLQKQDTG